MLLVHRQGLRGPAYGIDYCPGLTTVGALAPLVEAAWDLGQAAARTMAFRLRRDPATLDLAREQALQQRVLLANGVLQQHRAELAALPATLSTRSLSYICPAVRDVWEAAVLVSGPSNLLAEDLAWFQYAQQQAGAALPPLVKPPPKPPKPPAPAPTPIAPLAPLVRAGSGALPTWAWAATAGLLALTALVWYRRLRTP